jgi:type VI protein secretion system component Hcp
MSTDDRNQTQNQDSELHIEDLNAPTPDAGEAAQIKGGDTAAPKTTFSDIHITKPVDVSSPKLF